MSSYSRYRLLSAAGCLAVALCPTFLWAQRSVEVSVRASYLPLSSDEAALGPTHAWGVTPQVAVTLDRYHSVAVELFYTFVPSNSDPNNLTPRIQMAGAMLEITRGIDEHLSPVAMLGVGLIAYSPVSYVCPACLAETVSPYSNALSPTVTGGLGLEAALTSRVRLRGDIKAHLPLGATTSYKGPGSLRSEFGLGVRFRAR